MLPITTIVRQYLKKNNIRNVDIARHINDSPSNCLRKINRENVDVDFITKISLFCKHDFFADYMEQFKNGSGNLVAEESPAYSTEKVSKSDYEFLLKENISLYRKLEECRTNLETTKNKLSKY